MTFSRSADPLPVAGLVLLAAVGGTVLIRRSSPRPAVVLACVTLLLAVPLALLTRERNRVWRDDLAYWSDVVAKDPLAARSQMNRWARLGELLRSRLGGRARCG